MNDNLGKQNGLDEEIDLRAVLRGVENFFKQLLLGVIQIFKFYFKHKYVLLGLIIIGGVIGFLWENSFEKTYSNKLLVIPNFDSSNFVYDKVTSMDSKIKSGDTLTLKEIFGPNYEYVSSLEITPKIDIYNFVSTSESNKDLFQLMFEEETSLDFLENPINSMNYEFHQISLNIKGEKNHQSLSEALISHLNDNPFFQEIKELSLENFKLQLAENSEMISQIDTILRYSNGNIDANRIKDGVNFDDNTGLKDLIKMKKDLVVNNRFIKVNMTKESSVVNLVDANYKILDNEDFAQKSKIKLFPLLLIIIYSLVFLIRYLIKKAQSIVS